MLVLTRKQGQGFLLGDDIEITLLEISGDKIRIAINAPRDVRILRSELAEAEKSNREALMSANLPSSGLSELKSALSANRSAAEHFNPANATQVMAPNHPEQENPARNPETDESTTDDQKE